MNIPPKSVNPVKPPLGLTILRVVATPLAFVIPLYLLLMSGFIIFVPLVAFLAWLIQQARGRTLKGQWKFCVALFVASLALSGALVWGLIGRHLERPEVYVLQQGYVGWFRVRWSIPGAAPLPIEEGHYLMSIPATGLLNTSTVSEDGWMRHTFYYIDKAGHRTLLPDQYAEVKGPKVWEVAGRGQELICFVGTKEQFMNAGPDKNGGKPKGAS